MKGLGVYSQMCLLTVSALFATGSWSNLAKIPLKHSFFFYKQLIRARTFGRKVIETWLQAQIIEMKGLCVQMYLLAVSAGFAPGSWPILTKIPQKAGFRNMSMYGLELQKERLQGLGFRHKRKVLACRCAVPVIIATESWPNLAKMPKVMIFQNISMYGIKKKLQIEGRIWPIRVSQMLPCLCFHKALALVEEETRRYRPTKNYLDHLPTAKYDSFEVNFISFFFHDIYFPLSSIFLFICSVVDLF